MGGMNTLYWIHFYGRIIEMSSPRKVLFNIPHDHTFLDRHYLKTIQLTFDTVSNSLLTISFTVSPQKEDLIGCILGRKRVQLEDLVLEPLPVIL